MDVNESRLSWTTCKEPKVAELVRRLHLVLLLLHDGG